MFRHLVIRMRCERTEVGGQKTEVGGRRTEDGGRGAEDFRQNDLGQNDD